MTIELNAGHLEWLKTKGLRLRSAADAMVKAANVHVSAMKDRAGFVTAIVAATRCR
jgi:microcompartment protein CcmL/EutN